jgi:hypothetical protein
MLGILLRKIAGILVADDAPVRGGPVCETTTRVRIKTQGNRDLRTIRAEYPSHPGNLEMATGPIGRTGEGTRLPW